MYWGPKEDHPAVYLSQSSRLHSNAGFGRTLLLLIQILCFIIYFSICSIIFLFSIIRAFFCLISSILCWITPLIFSLTFQILPVSSSFGTSPPEISFIVSESIFIWCSQATIIFKISKSPWILLFCLFTYHCSVDIYFSQIFLFLRKVLKLLDEPKYRIHFSLLLLFVFHSYLICNIFPCHCRNFSTFNFIIIHFIPHLVFVSWYPVYRTSRS